MNVCPRPHDDDGFTLIELLVAITLMAVVSLMAWRGLDSIADFRHHLEVRAQETDGLLRLLGQLERDFTQRAPDMVLDAAATPSAAVGQNLPPRSLPLAIEVLGGEGPRMGPELRIVRAGPNQPGSWQQVHWWQQGDQLLRAAAPPTTRYPIEPPRAEDAAVVMGNVSRFQVLGWVEATGWQPLPRPADATTPVSGLQIVIERATGDQTETYRRILAFQ